MPAMTELAQVGKRQEIADAIFNIQPDLTPFLSSLKKGPTPKAMLATWQAEKYPEAASTPVVDGSAVSTYERVERSLLQSYGHFFRRPWAVTTLGDLTEIAGIDKNEVGNQRAKAMIILKRMIEQQLLSADDTQVDTGSVGYGLRGVFNWLKSSAQSVLPVPAAILPAAANYYTGAFASFGEDDIKTMFASAFAEKESKLDLVGYLGLTLKNVIDDFTQVVTTAASTQAPRTVFQVQGNKIYSNEVSQISFSAGRASLMVSEHLLRTTSTGAKGTYSDKAGILIDPTMWDICYMKAPANTNLPPDGSGVRGYVDAVAVLRCKNPRGQLKIEPSS